MSAIRVFNTAVQTMQKSQQNLAAVNMAREKHNREMESWKQKKKINDIKMDQAVTSGAMTKMDAEIQRSQYKQYLKQQQDIMKGREAQINATEQQNADTLKQSVDMAKMAYKSDPYAIQQSYSGMLEPYTLGGHTFFRQQRQPRQAQGETVTQKDVANLARQLTDDEPYDAENEVPYNQRLRKNMSVAREMLLGETNASMEQPQEKFNVGEVKSFGAKGKFKYIGNDQWEKSN
jgi:hypothetical protein